MVRVEKIIKNRDGEELTVYFSKMRMKANDPKNPTGYNTTVLIFENENIEIEDKSSSVYSTGEDVSKFFVSEKSIFISDGDRKRLETYPIWIYLNGDKRKAKRYQLRTLGA